MHIILQQLGMHIMIKCLYLSLLEIIINHLDVILFILNHD